MVLVHVKLHLVRLVANNYLETLQKAKEVLDARFFSVW